MFEEFVKKYNLPGFRLVQIEDAFYHKPISSFDEISTLSKEIRENLKKEIDFFTLIEVRRLESKNSNTIKVLFERKVDGQKIETVLMRHKDGRNTVCVSSMVGCPVGCEFCATGKMGFGGNLTYREIVDQVLYFNRYLLAQKTPARVTNVVYMGMGEPLLNLVEVQKSIEILIDPKRFGISKRKITISTSGYIPQFKKLVEDGFAGRVAISLHAPNQELRAKIMPVAKLFPLDKLIGTMKWYMELRNKKVSYEYIMIFDINDKQEHARELAELLEGQRLAHVNLIPYNPIYVNSALKIAKEKGRLKELPTNKYTYKNFLRSSGNRIHAFKKILENAGISTTIRVTMGDDVDAACGQLADWENKKNTSKTIAKKKEN